MGDVRHVLKGFNVFFMGKSYAGQIEECTLPKLAIKTEDFRDATMVAPLKLKMGVQPLDTDFTVVDFNPILLSSLSPREGTDVSFIFRGAYESRNGKVTPRIITMRGEVMELDQGQAQAGNLAKLKISMNLTYYSDVVDNVPVQEIDLLNNIWQKNGVDVMSDITNALGL